MAEARQTVQVIVPSEAAREKEYDWLTANADKIGAFLGVELIVTLKTNEPVSGIAILWQGRSFGSVEISTRFETFRHALARVKGILLLVNDGPGTDPGKVDRFNKHVEAIGATRNGFAKANYGDEDTFLDRLQEGLAVLQREKRSAKWMHPEYSESLRDTAEKVKVAVDPNSPEPTGEKDQVEPGDAEQDVSEAGRRKSEPDDEVSEEDLGESTRRLSTESVAGYGVSDHATEKDTLGFGPYVRAVAAFLRNRSTKPPFTMSIDGQWGSGKTSFMMQLEDELNGPQDNQNLKEWKAARALPVGWKSPITIWFNPWRHDKNESLWAAFALSCLHGIPAGMGIWEKQWAFIRMFWSRLQGKSWLVFKSLGKYIVAGVAIYLLFVNGNEWSDMLTGGEYQQLLAQIFGGTAYGGIALMAWRVWRILMPVVKEPLATDLVKHFQAPDYADQVTFLGRFHDEFHKMVSSLAGKRRVYVFIDDVDRCEVPRAADLMQAINLLTGGKAPLFFIIGMDREKVAAGVAAKHEKVLKYLIEKENRGASLEFGHEFIQKFIQLPFRVPTPTEEQLDGMLDQLVEEIVAPVEKDRRPGEGKARARSQSKTQEVAKPKSGDAPAEKVNAPGVSPEVVKLRAVKIEKFDKDSDAIKKVIKMVAPHLDLNPRRVKQFAGLFRLQYYLAVETGLCDLDQDGDSCLSVEQVGKFTALVYKWPSLVPMLEEQPLLLRVWEEDVLGREEAPTVSTEDVPHEVFKFLELGLMTYEEESYYESGPKEMHLGDVDVRGLLSIASPTQFVYLDEPESVVDSGGLGDKTGGLRHVPIEGEASAYDNLGLIYAERGELDQAEDMFLKSLAMNQTLGNQFKTASACVRLGHLCYIRGELDRAEEMHVKALEIYQELGLQEDIASQYGDLGTIYTKREELDRAQEMHVKALEIYQELGLQEDIASQYDDLGTIYTKRGDSDRAEEMRLKSIEINEKLRDSDQASS